jgi:hypothetical protein
MEKFISTTREECKRKTDRNREFRIEVDRNKMNDKDSYVTNTERDIGRFID